MAKNESISARMARALGMATQNGAIYAGYNVNRDGSSCNISRRTLEALVARNLLVKRMAPDGDYYITPAELNARCGF